MVVVEILGSARLALLLTGGLALLLEEIGRDPMHIGKGDARLGHDLTLPLAVGIVTAFNLVARPLIARRQ